MTEESAAAAVAMAAAIAAAAQIAEHAGISLFDAAADIVEESVTTATPVLVSSQESEADSLGNEKGTTGSNNDSEQFNSNSSDQADADEEEGVGEDLEEEQEEDAEKRLARSRERNREHARRTRLRKKAQLEILQSKAMGLEAERKLLQQSIEECSVASILLGISSGNAAKAVTDSLLNIGNKDLRSPTVSLVVGGKRKRFLSEEVEEKLPQPIKFTVDGQTTLVGGAKTHINWKTGAYCDENGLHKKLTPNQLESLRRERNRMHAKMTRDRKKCFIATIEKAIDELVAENKKMREALTEVAKHHFGPNAITPHSSPLVAGIENTCKKTPDIQGSMGSPAIASSNDCHTHIVVPHGFSQTSPYIAPSMPV